MYFDLNTEELIKKFDSTLLDTNRGYNFYINWNNIGGLEAYNVEFHALDCLIGLKENFDTTFFELLEKIPSVIKTFPFLFALSKTERKNAVSGKNELKIIGTDIDGNDVDKICFAVKGQILTKPEKEKYLDFFRRMGLKYLFQNIIEKSVTDYVIGVLVGLDSNGRKNRGGKAFELACEPMIRNICNKYGINVMTQKKFSTLSENGFEINNDIANRKADFILIRNEKCINIETNFYSGSGSKPEEIIDSYINRQSDLKSNNIKFILITDGHCWSGTTNQLSKGFRHLDYIMNFRMAKSGFLEKIISEEFEQNE